MKTSTEQLHDLDLRVPSLQRSDLVRMLRAMRLARALDDAELRLLRQQKVYFTINGSGHEAVQVAAAQLLRPGKDWFFPYYRDRALCLALGVTPRAMLLQAMGRRDDPSSGGRQMPSHFGDPDLHIVSQSSPTGTQFLQAVGVAEAARLARTLPLPPDDHPPASADEIVYVSSGEGATSEGEFQEALSTALLYRLPVLFLVEDNEYAISVPIEAQTPAGSISRLLKHIPGLTVIETDGLDPVASHADLARAMSLLRAGEGPVLVHARVVRLKPHSNSDDDRDYRPEGEREESRRLDPIISFEELLLREDVVTEEELDDIRRGVDVEVAAAVEEALAAPEPAATSIHEHLFAPKPEPALVEVSSEVSTWLQSKEMLAAPLGQLRGEQTLLESVRLTLYREMERDPRIVVFGQDVADASREEVLDLLKGKGGVFKVTAGLQRTFGSHRVFNTPIAEAAIVGRAIGMAVRGLRPVVEIQFFDYIWPAMMQIRNELALLRWRSNGGFAAPVVIRAPIGGYLRGGAIYHSQTGESIFCHCPGLRVVMPSNARDAAGLLRTSIRCGDPVIFLEHKHLYRQPYTRTPDPGPDFTIPLGKAEIVRSGSDITLVTWGALVNRALVAAEKLRRDDIDVEVIDLRSLQPYDFETVAESVRRTSRIVVASEEPPEFGVAAEIAARVGEDLFEDLDAPVARIGSPLVPVGYSPVLEQATLPQVGDILEAVRKTAEF